MSAKPKPRKFKQPTLNAIYKQQRLLRAAVAALVDQIEEMRVHQVEQLTLAIQHNYDTGARMEKLQFDRGVLIEKVRKYRELVLKKPEPLTVPERLRNEPSTVVYVPAPLYDAWYDSGTFHSAFIAFKGLPKPISVVRLEVDAATAALAIPNANLGAALTALHKIYAKASNCDPTHYNATMSEIIDIVCSVKGSEYHSIDEIGSFVKAGA